MHTYVGALTNTIFYLSFSVIHTENMFIILRLLDSFCIFVCIVLMVEFTSTSFTGSESSGEVLVTLMLSGGVSTSNITVMIDVKGTTATGHFICYLNTII